MTGKEQPSLPQLPQSTACWEVHWNLDRIFQKKTNKQKLPTVRNCNHDWDYGNIPGEKNKDLLLLSSVPLRLPGQPVSTRPSNDGGQLRTNGHHTQTGSGVSRRRSAVNSLGELAPSCFILSAPQHCGSIVREGLQRGKVA